MARPLLLAPSLARHVPCPHARSARAHISPALPRPLPPPLLAAAKTLVVSARKGELTVWQSQPLNVTLLPNAFPGVPGYKTVSVPLAEAYMFPGDFTFTVEARSVMGESPPCTGPGAAAQVAMRCGALRGAALGGGGAVGLCQQQRCSVWVAVLHRRQGASATCAQPLHRHASPPPGCSTPREPTCLTPVVNAAAQTVVFEVAPPAVDTASRMAGSPLRESSCPPRAQQGLLA